MTKKISRGPSWTQGPSPGSGLSVAGRTWNRGRSPKVRVVGHRGTRDRLCHEAPFGERCSGLRRSVLRRPGCLCRSDRLEPSWRLGGLGAYLARADDWGPSLDEVQRPSKCCRRPGRYGEGAEVGRSLRRLSTLCPVGTGVKVTWGPSRTRGPSPGRTLTAVGLASGRGRSPKVGVTLHRGTDSGDRRRQMRSPASRAASPARS